MVDALVYSLVVVIVIWLAYRLRKPLAPTNLFLRSDSMSVTAVWVKSASPNVVKQVISWTWTDSEAHSMELAPDVETFVIDGFPMPTHLMVSVTAHTDHKMSIAAVAELDIPDLSIPEPPTNLVLSFNE